MAVKIFLCYARKDERMINKLLTHLAPLKQEKFIEVWYDLDVNVGTELEATIHKYWRESQIILLLISPEFMSSSYFSGVEMEYAIARHERGEVRVLPIILRPVHWQVVNSLHKLQVLPDDAKPVIDWLTQDHGFVNVTEGIYKVVQQLSSQNLPDLIAEKRKWMENFEKFVEAVRSQLQPEVRANATAGTLQQLSALVPNGATLADLLAGWRILASPREGEEAGVVQRRVTCNDLAAIATQFTHEEGNLSRAIQVWQAWSNAFSDSTDPRHTTMAKTFSRELAELQESAR
jgi:hypothetical protein